MIGFLRSREGRDGRAAATAVAVLLALTLPHLGQGDYRSDAARYGAVGLQMWRTGEWFAMYIGDEPYFNKPPLPFLVHGFFLHAFGANLVALRLPTILASAGVVLVTMNLARRTLGRRRALAAGVVLAATYEFFRRNREVSLDMWQLLFLAAAADQAVRAIASRRPRGFLWAGAALGGALLCKPLNAFLAVPLLAAWLAAARQGRRWPWLLGTAAVAAAVAALWYVPMTLRFGEAFLRQHVGAEIADRSLGHINREPPWYYVEILATTYWPWAAAAAGGAWAARRLARGARRRRVVAMALVWAVVWFVALSAFPDKRPRYALPLYPALALVAAEGLCRWRTRRARAWLGRGMRGLAPGAAAIGVAIALLPIRFQAPPNRQWTELHAWLRANGAPRLCAPRLSTNDAGRFYLEYGWWPLRRETPRPGDLTLYHAAGGVSPGANEEVVFASGELTVARRR